MAQVGSGQLRDTPSRQIVICDGTWVVAADAGSGVGAGGCSGGCSGMVCIFYFGVMGCVVMAEFVAPVSLV